MELNTKTIYQISLRSFTKEGTLKSAQAHLEKVKELGADIIYLCPIAEADDDPNEQFWSFRQKHSGFNNPKNPYRIKDYFKIDPDYGTDEDLKNFVDKTHELGMKIILDLVYFHCGPKAVFLDEHPDYVKRDDAGEFAINKSWCFPLINYDKEEVREYFWNNMEYFIKEFDVDGYRCDVCDLCPEDFWTVGISRCKNLKKDVIFIAEGMPGPIANSGFDAFYGFSWMGGLRNMLLKKMPASELKNIHTYNPRPQYVNKEYNEYIESKELLLRCIDNHDSANDCYNERVDKNPGPEALEVMLVTSAFIDGILFIFAGNEYCDTNRYSIWFDRNHTAGLDCTINRNDIDSPPKKHRYELLKQLISLRKTVPAFSGKKAEFVYTDDNVIIFKRKKEDSEVIVAVNLTDTQQSVGFNHKIRNEIISKGYSISNSKITLQPYGYFAASISND